MEEPSKDMCSSVSPHTFLYNKEVTKKNTIINKCSKSTYPVRVQHSTYCLSIEAQLLAPSRVMKLPRFNHVLNRLYFGHSEALTCNTVRTATSCSSHIDTEEASIQSVQLPHTYTTVVYLLNSSTALRSDVTKRVP